MTSCVSALKVTITLQEAAILGWLPSQLVYDTPGAGLIGCLYYSHLIQYSQDLQCQCYELHIKAKEAELERFHDLAKVTSVISYRVGIQT